MPTTGGGIKFFEKSKALEADGASMVVTSGEATKEFALNGNQNFFLRTSDSGDLIEEQFDVTFSSSSKIDRLLLRNHNFKTYKAFWFDGVQYRDFSNVLDIDNVSQFSISETAYAKDTSYYEFDEVETTKIRIQVTTTQEIIGKPDDGTFFASLKKTKDGTWGDGDLTGTLNGGAVISAGFLNMVGGAGGDSADWPGALNASTLINSGTAIVNYTPNYTGTPGSAKYFFAVSKASGDASNEFSAFHSGVGGKIGITVRDSVGATIANVVTDKTWAPTINVEYEIAATFNIALGLLRVFIDRVPFETIQFTSALTRDSSVGLIRVGSNVAATNSPDARFRSLKIFSSDVLEPEVFLYANFDAAVDPENATEAKGSKVATLTGAASVSGGVLDLKSGGYADWPGLVNGNLEKQFEWTADITPDYSGTPTTFQTFFYMGNTADNNNAAVFFHDKDTGQLTLTIRDNAASVILSVNLGVWAPVASTLYKFRLFIDIENGNTFFKLDSTQFGATSVVTGDRAGADSVDVIRTGRSKNSDSGTADYEIDNFRLTPLPSYKVSDFPDVPAEKFINQIVPTKEKGTFAGFPLVAGPTHHRNARVKRMLSGKTNIQKSEDSLTIKLRFQDYPSNDPVYKPDVDLMFTLFDDDDPFIIWPCGGRSGVTRFGYTLRGWRLRDLYQVGMLGELDVRYLANIYLNPVSFDVDMAEAL